MIPIEFCKRAEELRIEHCDNKGHEHECVGKLTVQPGLVILNCSKCGVEFKQCPEMLGKIPHRAAGGFVSGANDIE